MTRRVKMSKKNYHYQNTPFGFNTVQVGSLVIYCGKLRFRGVKYIPDQPYLNVAYNGEYCIISFEVTDREYAVHLYRTLGKLAKSIAQARLDEKWGWLSI